MKLTSTQRGDFQRFCASRQDQETRRLLRLAFEEGVRSERERVLDNIDDAYTQRGAFISDHERQRLVAAIRLDHIA